MEIVVLVGWAHIRFCEGVGAKFLRATPFLNFVYLGISKINLFIDKIAYIFYKISGL